MAGIWINDQLRFQNSLREVVCIYRRNHYVVVSIYDERRMTDILQLGISFSMDFAPSCNCCSLSLHCLRRARRIDAISPQMTPRPKGFAGGLACLGRAKEQIKKCLEPRLSGFWIGRGAVLSCLRVLRCLPTSWASSHEQKAPGDRGMAKGERLRDVTPDGKSKNINKREAQGGDEVGRILCHCFDGIRGFTA